MSLNEDSPNNKIQTNLNVLAKILSTKKLTINVVRTILYPTGKLGEKLSMSHKEGNYFHSCFQSREDMLDIMDRGPWNINGALVVLKI